MFGRLRSEEQLERPKTARGGREKRSGSFKHSLGKEQRKEEMLSSSGSSNPESPKEAKEALPSPRGM